MSDESRTRDEGDERPTAVRREPTLNKRLDHERETETARADDALGRADEFTRDGYEEAATAAYGDAHEHEHKAAAFGADERRYEAANAYSTTVAGPPGPKNVGAQQTQGQQSAQQQQRQQSQAPKRRVP
ncbi:hypothetical protein GCM10009801_81800 [Streptomyces albiaxialis]|uniref:Uncharacterized protein n=1 Tax=Streptomyces albiaxialis TaxID=329523 RepID=A0ABP5IVZ9_9ACTN